MRIVVWVAEATWPSCVDTARMLPASEVVLLHVIGPDTERAVDGARAGLLGRGLSADGSAAALLEAAQNALLDDAAARLGRAATRVTRQGRPEREVVAACADADLLVLARDGDRGRLGPKSLGPHTRFVVDHAPCRVLLVWPDDPPALETMPPPPPPPH
jgi:nucleotide-binding universal stress UspA family protein